METSFLGVALEAVAEGEEEVFAESLNSVLEGNINNYEIGYSAEKGYSFQSDWMEEPVFGTSAEIEISQVTLSDEERLAFESFKLNDAGLEVDPAAQEAASTPEAQESTKNNIKNAIEQEKAEGGDGSKTKQRVLDGIKTFLKVLFGVGVTIGILEAMAIAKSGCYVEGNQGTFKQKVDKTTDSDTCKCGLTSTGAQINENVLIKGCNAYCETPGNSGNKCSTFKVPTSECGCINSDKTDKSELNLAVHKYEFWDIAGELYGDVGYIFNAAGDAVKAVPDIISNIVAFLKKYWWIPLIIVGALILILLLPTIIHALRKI